MYPVPVISRARLRFSAPLLAAALTAVARLAAGEALTLATATDREYYLPGGSRQYLIETRIGTAEVPADAGGAASAPAAAPRNLAFVLDRSGSMAGEPLDAVRAGLRAVVAALGERDVLSVVFFGSEVETLAEARGRGELGDFDASLARVEAAGGAALYDALNQGAAQLRRNAGPTTINHLILITDGPPTKGPRELEDFTKLTAVFVREGFTFSTIGLGEDFNEDMLATLARIGNGHFHYAAQPQKLAETLQAEIAPRRTLIARDAVLTVEFNSQCDDVTAYGWKLAITEHETVTYHFPYLFAEQELSLLASAVVRPRPFGFTLATVRLRWNDPAGGGPREITRKVSVQFEANDYVVRQSARPTVIRTSVSTLISEGLQRAIEFIDKGDFKRALRALRQAREDAQSLNYDLEDTQAKARIGQLEIYLAEVQARGMNPLDRKILRSGLFNQFETPTEEPKDKK